jgi:hypothetical protein
VGDVVEMTIESSGTIRNRSSRATEDCRRRRPPGVGWLRPHDDHDRRPGHQPRPGDVRRLRRGPRRSCVGFGLRGLPDLVRLVRCPSDHLLRSVGKLLTERRDEYAALITAEMGKPLAEALAEIDKCAWNCDVVADLAPGWLADHLVESSASRSWVSYEPLGVVFA